MLSRGGFDCSQCGKCCATLQDAPGAPRYPESYGAMAATGWYPLATEQGLQVWPWERDRMERAAREVGRPLHFRPNTVLLDAGRERVVILLYELAHLRCPFLQPGGTPEALVCGAYAARPLVCRAYPVMLRAGSLAYSSACPSAMEPAGEDAEAWRRAYGASFEAAAAAGATGRRVRETVEFLALVGDVSPLRGQSKAELERYLACWPQVDLVEVLRNSQAVSLHDFLDGLPPPPADATAPRGFTLDSGGMAAP